MTLEFTRVQIMDPLISLEHAKDHIKETSADYDAEIQRMIIGTQNEILDYLKSGADATWTESTLPYPVRASILRLFAHRYGDRGDKAEDSPVDDEKTWQAIERMLDRFRDPTVA